jgi:cell wall-associated NlpC family hydrolase
MGSHHTAQRCLVLAATVTAMTAAGLLNPGTATAATPPAATITAASSAGDRAVAAALTQVGVPYVWGGESPSGFDCSGLVQWAYSRAEVSLPRTSKAQSTRGAEVSRSDIQTGDLLFYGSSRRNIWHVAMAVDSDTVIQAPQPGDRVSTRSLYTKNLVVIRRPA